MLKNLGVKTQKSKYGEVPVYDKETFETNVAGIYVAGHFTEARHISGRDSECRERSFRKLAGRFAHEKTKNKFKSKRQI